MKIVPDMVGVTVKDLKTSVAFYRLLGLDFPDPGKEDYVEFIASNGYRISLNAESLAKQLNPHWVAPKGQQMELAFKCGSPVEVDSVVTTLRKAGHTVVKEPWDAFWGQRYAMVADPDGIHVSLFAPL